MLYKCTRRVSGWLVHQTRKHAVGTIGAIIIQLVIILEDLIAYRGGIINLKTGPI